MVVSLLIVLASYALVSWRDQSLLNFQTPYVVMAVPTFYVLPWASMLLSGPFGSMYAYFYYYGTTAAVTLVSALVYCFIKPPQIGWQIEPRPVKRAHWICVILSAVVFCPILLQYGSYLTTPRVIYQHTRAGAGIYFFTSSFLLNLAFVFFLFVKQKTFFSSITFLALVVSLSLLHGSKGKVLSFLWMWVIYKVYVERERFKFWRTVVIGTIPVIVMAFLFVFFQKADPADLFFAMARYSNYPEVAMMAIDDSNLTPKFGRITLETAVYGRIPRALLPSKPTKFGPFELVSKYFQKEDWDETGAPDFGLGVQYYDFGDFAALYLCAWAAGTAYFARGLVKKLQSGPSRANYVLLAFLAGIIFVPTGVGYCLPEQLALAYLLSLSGRVKITLWSRRANINQSDLSRA